MPRPGSSVWRELRVRLVTARKSDPRAMEGYRRLRTNLQFMDVQRPVRSLMVTSAGPGEGKSLTAANLAIVMARAGRRVCLVDADLRHPVMDKTFGVSNYQGLTDILLSGCHFADHLHRVPVGREGELAEGVLDLLPSGLVPPNPSDLLASDSCHSLIAAMSQSYDCIVLDTAPVLPVDDAVSLAPRVDGVLVVVRTGRTRYSAARQAIGQLESVGARVLGVVANGVRREAWEKYYQHSRDYYAYRPGSQRSTGTRR